MDLEWRSCFKILGKRVATEVLLTLWRLHKRGDEAIDPCFSLIVFSGNKWVHKKLNLVEVGAGSVAGVGAA